MFEATPVATGSSSDKEFKSQSESTAEIIFADHDAREFPENALNDVQGFRNFLENPQSFWPAEVDDRVSSGTHNQVLCIDGIKAPNDELMKNEGLLNYFLRVCMVEGIPFTGENNGLDLVLADPSLGDFLSSPYGTVSYGIDDEQRLMMKSEIRTSEFKDYLSQYLVNAVLFSVCSSVIFYLRERSAKVAIQKGMSRRTFLSAAGIALLGALAKNAGLFRENVFDLNDDSDKLALELTEVFSPDIEPFDVVDGRTALMFSATHEYSQAVEKNAKVLLGTTHLHFAERIIADKNFRMEKIQGLFEAYLRIIPEICKKFQIELPQQEVSALAKKIITTIKVAHVKKPTLDQAEQAFSHPDQFVKITNSENISEILEAIHVVT